MSEPVRILLVEDNEPDALLIRELLVEARNFSFQLTCVRRLSEALARLDTSPCDAVLLDLSLPDSQGLQTLTAMLGKARTTPIVVLTGHDDETSAVASVQQGAQDYLVKGQVDASLLVRALRYAIERKRTEEALRNAHIQNERLLAAISSILIGVDKNDCVAQWNAVAERTFGIAAEAVVGRPFQDCGIRWDWSEMVRWIAANRGKEVPVRSGDIRYTGPDGRERLAAFTLTSLREEAESEFGFLLVGRDITEQRQLEGQMAHAQKMEAIGRLAAGIAHEINTPTQYIGDNTRFLQDSFADLVKVLEKYREFFAAAQSGNPSPRLPQDIQALGDAVDIEYLTKEIPLAIKQSLDGIERVTKIVRAMKEFSHPGVAEKTPIDINRAIESTVTVARNEWKYVADLVTDFDSSLPLVPCLPGDFNQVMLNLIVNSAHAIGDVVKNHPDGKGKITISTRRDGDWAEIRVSDTGPGIPESIRDKIFDPFFTTKEVGKGTGQGLAIARSVIVDKHGGALSFESEPGRGTTFIIRLPLEATATTET